MKQNNESAHRDDMWCRTCHLFPETQQHLFQCTEIREKLNFVNFGELAYNMIHSNLENQEKFAKCYHLMLKARIDILNE